MIIIIINDNNDLKKKHTHTPVKLNSSVFCVIILFISDICQYQDQVSALPHTHMIYLYQNNPPPLLLLMEANPQTSWVRWTDARKTKTVECPRIRVNKPTIRGYSVLDITRLNYKVSSFFDICLDNRFTGMCTP